jgi:hypothetical protein
MFQRTALLAVIATIGLTMPLTIEASSAKEQFIRGQAHAKFYRGDTSRAHVRSPRRHQTAPRIKSAGPGRVNDLVFIELKVCARTSGHKRGTSYGPCVPPPP